MNSRKIRILGINPWIYDFAAFDLWLAPLGLLSVLNGFRLAGADIDFIDCLEQKNTKKFGTGFFERTRVPLRNDIRIEDRYFARYGISIRDFVHQLHTRFESDAPDLILITTLMTYWYPGAFKTIQLCKQIFPETPIWLGGRYASSCYAHACENSRADYVVKQKCFDDPLVKKWVSDQRLNPQNLQEKTNLFKASSLLHHRNFRVIGASVGCPYQCTYCTQGDDTIPFYQREIDHIIDEIDGYVFEEHISDIAFYDDAFLVKRQSHFVPLAKKMIQRYSKYNVRFHVPNAIHASMIDEETAQLLFDANFKTIRIGFETVDQKLQKETGGKITTPRFVSAVKNLEKSGFSASDIGVYLLVGIPAQNIESVYQSIRFVKELGCSPKLCEFSPIPGTPDFYKHDKESISRFLDEPLWQNNTLMPYWHKVFTPSVFSELKAYAYNKISQHYSESVLHV